MECGSLFARPITGTTFLLQLQEQEEAIKVGGYFCTTLNHDLRLVEIMNHFKSKTSARLQNV
jgi:hypothetical protein